MMGIFHATGSPHYPAAESGRKEPKNTKKLKEKAETFKNDS